MHLLWLMSITVSPSVIASPPPPVPPQAWWSSFNPSVIGGFVGGLTGGAMAVVAQVVANLLQRNAARGAEKRALRGTLKAMMVELTVLKQEFVDRIFGILEKRTAARDALRPTGKNLPPLQWTPSVQNYFTIFESNSSALGRLKDDKLLEAIVRVYGNAKGLFDTLNASPPLYQRWLQLPDISVEKSRLWANLDELEELVRRDTTELSALIATVIQAIKESLGES
jgi:hypothetical protein